MATWQLCRGQEGLKLSVPVELQAEIGWMLSEGRSHGCILEAQVDRLARSWELVGAEVVSAAVGCPEPAIFLVHKESAQAIVVAKWPSVEFSSGGSVPLFDPSRHFAQYFPIQPNSTCTELRTDMSSGDRVEVEYDGRWFSGVLQWVDGDIANVKCDVDLPGVITVAPLTSVRPARTSLEERPKFPRHMRARSMG